MKLETSTIECNIHHIKMVLILIFGLIKCFVSKRRENFSAVRAECCALDWTAHLLCDLATFPLLRRDVPEETPTKNKKKRKKVYPRESVSIYPFHYKKKETSWNIKLSMSCLSMTCWSRFSACWVMALDVGDINEAKLLVKNRKPMETC